MRSTARPAGKEPADSELGWRVFASRDKSRPASPSTFIAAELRNGDYAAAIIFRRLSFAALSTFLP